MLAMAAQETSGSFERVRIENSPWFRLHCHDPAQPWWGDQIHEGKLSNFWWKHMGSFEILDRENRGLNTKQRGNFIPASFSSCSMNFSLYCDEPGYLRQDQSKLEMKPRILRLCLWPLSPNHQNFQQNVLVQVALRIWALYPGPLCHYPPFTESSKRIRGESKSHSLLTWPKNHDGMKRAIWNQFICSRIIWI